MDNDNKAESGKAGVIIERFVGCGMFQVIVTICLFFLTNLSSAFTMLLMAFGNYDPGWRCNDIFNSNDSFPLTDSNMSIVQTLNFGQASKTNGSEILLAKSQQRNANGTGLVVEEELYRYAVRENCPLFTSCKDIEFDPTTSTIVSEWGLLCDKKWISSIIISIQMAGVLVGSLLVGHLGDAFGRKPVVFGSVLVTACLNMISSFSVSWEMFAAIRFLLGITCALVMCIYYVFAAEFVPQKWRSVLVGVPCWSINAILWVLTCMGLKNWRHIQRVSAIAGVVGFIPALWIPESLRWLEVRNKSIKFKRAAEKIARINRKQLPSFETLQEMANSGNKRSGASTGKMYNFLHLFNKQNAKRTVMLTVPWFALVTVTYSLTFGVKALQGNFYINLMFSHILSIPCSIFPIFLPNLVGRKWAALIFGGIIAMSLLGAAIFELVGASESVRSVGIPALVFTAIAGIDGLWCTISIFTMELYPTVIRGLIVSWGSTVGRVGSILSPFLSPEKAHGAYVSYTIMSALIFVSCGILLGLPETKGMPLRDTMETRKKKNDANVDSVYHI